MEQKVFSIQGMTCTTCSNTLFNGLSRLPGIEHVSVCLLTEKVLLKGRNLNPDKIKLTIENLGFDCNEIKEWNILDGEVTFELIGSELINKSKIQSVLKKKNGISDVEFLEKPNLIKVLYVADAIKAREIAYFLEDATNMKISVYNENSRKGELIEKQHKTMRIWLKEFLGSLIFTIPIFILGIAVTQLVDSDNLEKERTGDSLPACNLAMWFLATPVQFWFGLRFYKGSYKSLKSGIANMDVLIVLGTSSAYIYGAIMNMLYIFDYQSDTNMHYIEASHSFETSSLLISIILLGKYLESRSKHKTTDAITKLANLQISSAVLLENGTEREVDLALLEVGNIVKVYPGSSIPVDGIVIEGDAWVNEAMMTGESSLVNKTKNSNVFGGTIVNTGVILVEIKKLGKDSALAQIIDLVENAQSTKPAIQKFADKISRIFVPCVVLFAIITWIVWFCLVYGENHNAIHMMNKINECKFVFAFKFGISVLIIACPCALGLAVPTVIMVATGVATRYGILIKDGESLENAAKIKTIVFDKTGTLTSGKPKVKEFIMLLADYNEANVRELVASVEANSEHPVAKAICEGIKNVKKCQNFHNIEGEGVTGIVDNKDIYVGNTKLMERFKIQVDGKITKIKENFENKGQTVVFAATNRQILSLIVLEDQDLVRPEAPIVVKELKTLGYAVWMITGDNERCAKRVAEAVGIPICNVLANCYPADKKSKVEELQYQNLYKKRTKSVITTTDVEDSSAKLTNKASYGGVLFVGDGINDSPSLAQADIGIAIGGTDIAIDAASIVLLKNDLKDVLIALDLTSVALRRIKYNFFWTFIYNIIGIPMAAGVIYMKTGVYIDSIMAAATMACSSIAVIFSSLWLNRYKPPKFRN
ncbi:HMA4 [Blepharisma stoltei]|uniref:HMA domain-containing protein n=1 Tax=Blepharisma stoltei TaxID=1481888 RepID=A0AAU9K1R5_9CILI|nr:unnamed protein product [Blepharisma stoltei]